MTVVDYLKGLIWVAMVVATVWQVARHWRPVGRPTPGDSQGEARAETLAIYTQAAESMRHYAGLRFTMLTVFVAVATAFAGLLAVAPMISPTRGWLALVAMGTTGAFFVMQERAVDHWKYSFRTAASVEAEWGGHRLYSDWAEAQLLSATNAVRLLHVLFGLLWLIVLGA
jgi:hypothetical protein